MRQTSPFSRRLAQPVEIGALSLRVEKALNGFVEARKRWNLAPDEALILLAIGRAGLLSSSEGVTVRPVTCLNLAQMLNIPKETVRRKTARLVTRELALTTTRGVIIRNIDDWRDLASSILI